jgi:hypothetical protein
MKMPRYYFVVRAQDHERTDPDGMILAGPNTAREHGYRVVRELKDGGYRPAGATLHVLDETGETIHSIPF